MDGKIGNYTYADLLARVRDLGQRGRVANKEQAHALLPEAHQLINLIREHGDWLEPDGNGAIAH